MRRVRSTAMLAALIAGATAAAPQFATAQASQATPRPLAPSVFVGAPWFTRKGKADTLKTVEAGRLVQINVNVIPGARIGQPRWSLCAKPDGGCRYVLANMMEYQSVPADIGSYIRVTVIGIPETGRVQSETTDPLQVVAPSGLPEVTGATPYFQTITGFRPTTLPLNDGAMVQPGDWAYAPTFSFVWQMCDVAGKNCAAIPGLTGKTFKPAYTDQDRHIRVLVTATNAKGVTLDSTPLLRIEHHPQPLSVAGEPPFAATGPRSARVDNLRVTPGTALYAMNGTWINAKSFTYEWSRCIVMNNGGLWCERVVSTDRSYTPVPADAGKVLSLVVTARNDSGTAFKLSPWHVAVDSTKRGP